MNIYDKINELASSLKESSEFKDYVAKKEVAYQKQENKDMIKSFREKQIELQQLAINGNEQEAKMKTELLQQMYQILLQNSEIKEMFDAEVRFDVMIGDMYRILGEAIREAMED